MSLEQPGAFVKHPDSTIDAFLDGRLTLAQPRRGFRAGLDSVLLGAAVDPDSRSVLDLGAGVGAAALVALTHHARRTAQLAEVDPAMVRLAADNIARNGLADRAEVTLIDVTAAAARRIAAGLKDNAFDSVIANPPYFNAAAGTAASTRGRGARHMPGAALERWVRTATAAAAPGGEVVFVLPAALLSAVLAAFASRLGALTILPLSPRAGAAASRILVRGRKGSRAALTLLSTRVLHGDGDGFAEPVESILRGTARLVW